MSTSTEHDAKAYALRIAGTTARQAEQKKAEWTERRDKAIHIARIEGASLREIATATGLSHVGVKKILDLRRSEPKTDVGGT